MTIRLRCAACQRKLKVPDEALGHKVQCPACGARFIGRIEPASPPQATEPHAPGQPKEEAAFPPREEAAASPVTLPKSPPVDPPLAETISLPPEEASTPALHRDEEPVVDMLFTEMASHPLEEADPLAFHDEEHMEIVNDVDDEEARPSTRPRKPKQSAKPSAEESEMLEEEDDGAARRDKAPKGKKSRQGLLLVLAGILCALLLGLGFLVYRFVTGD